MRKLKIAVFTEEKEYALDLARGLCSQSSGIEVLVAEYEAQAFDYVGRAGVVITDKETGFASQTLILTGERAHEDLIAGNVKKVYKISPVSEILQAAVSVCFENTGEVFYPEQEAQLKVWEFFSPWGGSGTTSIALTCAGLLASEPGEKVLYINLGITDDYEMYTDICFDKVCSKRRFIYAVETQSKIMTDNCFAVDGYGVFYFKPELEKNGFLYETDRNRILDFLRKSRKFTHLIIDSGKRCAAFSAGSDLMFKISREKDVRRDKKATDGEIEIVNFSSTSGLRDGKFYLPLDEEGFSGKEGKLNIRMESRFAAAVSQMMRGCLKRGGSDLI